MPQPAADKTAAVETATTYYQFDLPERLWIAYKRTVPATMSVKQAMQATVARAVLDSSITHPAPPAFGDDVIDGQLWQQWCDSVPRSVALADRLEDIIRADLRADQRGGYGDVEERTARLMADRIKHRSKSALAAMERDCVECESAEDNLEKVVEIAESFDA